MVILVFGISAGIEKISKFMMPAFFILSHHRRAGGLPARRVGEGISSSLLPDFSKLLEPMTWVYAMGQAFFSLSINGAQEC